MYHDGNLRSEREPHPHRPPPRTSSRHDWHARTAAIPPRTTFSIVTHDNAALPGGATRRPAGASWLLHNHFMPVGASPNTRRTRSAATAACSPQILASGC